MAPHSLITRLSDILEAIERIKEAVGDMPLDAFEADWQKQWLVERGVEILSEASRHLTDTLSRVWHRAIHGAPVTRRYPQSIAVCPPCWEDCIEAAHIE
jgi:hypothetical protein